VQCAVRQQHGDVCKMPALQHALVESVVADLLYACMQPSGTTHLVIMPAMPCMYCRTVLGGSGSCRPNSASRDSIAIRRSSRALAEWNCRQHVQGQQTRCLFLPAVLQNQRQSTYGQLQGRARMLRSVCAHGNNRTQNHTHYASNPAFMHCKPLIMFKQVRSA
jgi:hypothetical protein